jgi:ElaB/YqjD/DUF883 family membrane-anchored ribosome-binding protein
MTQSLTGIDALRAERSALVAEAEALLARSRSRPAMEQAIALYGRAEHLAREEQLRLLATLKSRTTPHALGARSWVEFVSTQLDVSHDDARLVLRDVDALGP